LSQPKLISPLLENYSMGEPISEHQGVSCYPAMPNGSDDKYIVKIISIPASQVQLKALLLAGAYPDEEGAAVYFRELAQGIEDEVKIIEQLSKLEGFLPFSGCQSVDMEQGTGSLVYLLSPYRPSLAAYLKRNNMTHLAAINLGLDLCASMALCRQSGYQYVNLKPENIFICHDREYRIGDIGFVRLDSLKYASLPSRYQSPYTAPEVQDAYSQLSDKLDIYAIGLILYQVYNGGVLPRWESPEDKLLPPPEYADYELSEIILKACARDPQERWANPMEMGQALVAYMQRNGVNDVPIVAPPEERPEEVFDPEPEDEPEVQEEELAPEESVEIPQIPDISELNEDQGKEEATEQICLDEFYAYFADSPEGGESPQEGAGDPEIPAEDPGTEDSEEDLLNLSFLDDLTSDDTAPGADITGDIPYDELSQDASDILAQADDLISHETPAGVVAPEAPEIPMPAPIVFEEPKEEPKEEPEEAPEDAPAEAPAPAEEPAAEETPAEDPAPAPVYVPEEPEEEDSYDPGASIRTAKKWIAWFVVLLMLIGLFFGGYMFYHDYYIRTVSSLVLSGSEDTLVVSVTADVDDSLLTVQCMDTYGTLKEAPVVAGQAVFTDLNPNTLYTVKVQVIGLRKLLGEISDSYTTPVQTTIVSFTAVTGNEPGSAILSFTVDGMDSETWAVVYTAPGEEEKKQIFSGHMVNIAGLVSGKDYTFRLVPGSDLYITGQDTLKYVARDPVFAQDLAIIGCTADSLTVAWTLPEYTKVEGWTVRCYSESGYDKTVETDSNTVVFEGLNGSEAHTVEVIAHGMSAGTRCYMTAGAVTVSNLTYEALSPTSVRLSWDAAGKISDADWIITYQGDRAEYQEMTRTGENTAVLTGLIPGADYTVEILLEDGTTVFTQKLLIPMAQAADFDGFGLKRENITSYMVRTPQGVEDWEMEHLKAEDYTDTFLPDEKASFLLRADKSYNPMPDVVDILYVIRDAEGTLISGNITQRSWMEMWYKRSCELDIPEMPKLPGTYSIEIYFNGGFVHTQTFHISEG